MTSNKWLDGSWILAVVRLLGKPFITDAARRDVGSLRTVCSLANGALLIRPVILRLTQRPVLPPT
jgi:hypothetical protein